MTARYTGWLRKGDAPDTIQGELVDEWQWRIVITGIRDPDGGYRLTGVLGEPPASLRVPAIDGEETP